MQSVAGIEMGFNAYENFLTRLQCSLQLYAQAVIGAAWSVAGDMYTNRGPYALYRAGLIREYLAVYSDEMFFGRRVILGDDSLSPCARAPGPGRSAAHRGRADDVAGEATVTICGSGSAGPAAGR